MFRAFLQEFRLALRSLMRSPWFALVSIAMLASGLGLSLYMFGAINGFLLKPPPFADIDRLMHVEYADTRTGEESIEVPLHDFIDLRREQRSLASLAAYYEGTINLSDGRRPERYDGAFVTADAFDVLGIRPLLGRGFLPEDAAPGAARVVLISHALWQNRFGGQAEAVGGAIRLNGSPATIIGVMPEGFRFPRMHDAWTPINLDLADTPRGRAATVEVFGVLAEGVDRGQAQQEFDTLAGRLATMYPDTAQGDRAVVKPFAEEFINQHTRRILWTLFAAVVLVLLIACANVANLLVARGAARARELAIRGALGAGRWRLTLQCLAEALCIALPAVAIGVLLASWGGELTMRAIIAAEDAPVYWVGFDLSGYGVLFAIAIVLGSALLAGVLPAANAWRLSQATQLRDGGHGATSASRWGRLLVVGEIAFCMALLVGAGLTVRSALKLEQLDLGVRTEGVLTGRVALFPDRYPDNASRVRFSEEIVRRLEQVPGVRSAALSTAVPLMGSGRSYYLGEGQAPPADGRYPLAALVAVTPGYFPVYGVAADTGRVFRAGDDAEAPPVAVVNRSMAARLWPGADPLGRRFKLDPANPESAWVTVVGVVPDTIHRDIDATQHQAVYVPFAQRPAAFVSLAVQGAGDPLAFADGVRRAVSTQDADMPVYWLRSMDRWRDIALWDARLLGRLFGLFAGFGLALAVTGIYAVLAYAVSQRTREIGVRRALGAQDRGILRMVFRQGLGQLGAGLLIGGLLGLGFGRLLSNFLFEVSSFDPVTFIGVAVVLGLAAMLAGLVPARRALRVQPMVALRYE